MASISKLKTGKWRARYYDETGRQHAKHFDRKIDGQRWLDEVTAAVVTGQYVDPKAGRMTFKEYAERWRSIQVHRESSQKHVEHLLNRHVYPALGPRPLATILPSDIQHLVKRLGVGHAADGRKPLAPSTVGVVHAVVSSIFKSAVRDRRVASNPCEGTSLPKVSRPKIVPYTTEQVMALSAAMPEELRAMVTFAAGTGLRPSECTGLTVDRLEMLRREVKVDQQLVTLTGQEPRLGPPKTEASNRTVPLPQVVVDATAAHLAQFSPGRWDLVFTIDGEPITRQKLGHIWRPAVAAAGMPKGTRFHGLRHYYASLLIRYGESVKTVQERLGHATAAETLDTYSHLWPDSDDRTREAVDAALGSGSSASRIEA